MAGESPPDSLAMPGVITKRAYEDQGGKLVELHFDGVPKVARLHCSSFARSCVAFAAVLLTGCPFVSPRSYIRQPAVSLRGAGAACGDLSRVTYRLASFSTMCIPTASASTRYGAQLQAPILSQEVATRSKQVRPSSPLPSSPGMVDGYDRRQVVRLSSGRSFVVQDTAQTPGMSLPLCLLPLQFLAQM